MIIFNAAALLFGLGSLVIALVVGYAVGWIPRGADLPPPREDPVLLLFAGLLIASDLAWRLRKIKYVNVPDPLQVFRRDGPVSTRPKPVTKTLNLFLSGELGAQLFWVVPGWVLGILALTGFLTA